MKNYCPPPRYDGPTELLYPYDDAEEARLERLESDADYYYGELVDDPLADDRLIEMVADALCENSVMLDGLAAWLIKNASHRPQNGLFEPAPIGYEEGIREWIEINHDNDNFLPRLFCEFLQSYIDMRAAELAKENQERLEEI